MKQGSKFLRVMLKLYLRSLKRSPHAAAITLMGVITFGLSTYVSYDAWKNYGRFSQSTFTKWNNLQKEITGRNIANVQTAQCQENFVNFNNLAHEIKLIESQFETGHYNEGNWYGVNFKNLPAIQAQFLADYGEYIGDANASKDFSYCQDVPCILGSFYNGDQEAGMLAYYWYLKTGSMISMSNKIPAQKSKYAGNYDNKKHVFHDYLFSKQELKNFFILAKSLPEKFLHNPLLKSIHKIPNNSKIENYSHHECTVSTSSGHILINQTCLGHGNDIQKFLLTISTQMARYIDLYEGQKRGVASLSSSQEWLDKSLWLKEEFYDLRTRRYGNKWHSHLPQKQFVSQQAKTHPTQQLAQLISYYRFKPTVFANNTPADLQEFIRTEIYNKQRFDGNGLYKQYITQAVNQWSKSEVALWADCFEQHLKPNAIESSARDLASQVDNPLYSCVEQKIPSFVQEVVKSIKNENFEGCKFFQDQHQYGHLAKQFHHVLDKFLQERILKRKIEFQNHGLEVLVGQSIKHEFIKNVDPSSVFINCYNEEDQRSCYEGKMLNEVSKLLNKNHSELSEYYKKIIKDDVLQLFPYDVVVTKTNEITKKFIAPFYSKIHFSATHLWESCKSEKFSTEKKIKLPMKFSGGKHFVNAGLLNCINDKMEEELDEIVSLGAFHEQDEKILEFKLNSKEEEFALSFMEGKLVQILNNILENEVKLEESKLAQHFQEANGKIAKDLMADKDFFDEVYSFSQVTNECLERVQDYYPGKYFYSSTSKVDNKYGRKICSTIMSNPEVKSGLTKKVQERWDENKKLAVSFLDEHFEEYVEDCNDDYPAEMGRAYIRNSRMRKICIEESFEIALNDAMVEWSEDDHYEYFQDKEQQLARYLMGLRSDKVNSAINPPKSEK